MQRKYLESWERVGEAGQLRRGRGQSRQRPSLSLGLQELWSISDTCVPKAAELSDPCQSVPEQELPWAGLEGLSTPRRQPADFNRALSSCWARILGMSHKIKVKAGDRPRRTAISVQGGLTGPQKAEEEVENDPASGPRVQLPVVPPHLADALSAPVDPALCPVLWQRQS